MKKEIEFERCVDFLSRMVVKYGPELVQELSKDEKISTPKE